MQCSLSVGEVVCVKTKDLVNHLNVLLTMEQPLVATCPVVIKKQQLREIVVKIYRLMDDLDECRSRLGTAGRAKKAGVATNR